jgi:hypothetical protein
MIKFAFTFASILAFKFKLRRYNQAMKKMGKVLKAKRAAKETAGGAAAGAPLPCVLDDVAATGTLRSDDVASTGTLCCG